jgi:hypothetical protein
LSSPKIQQSKPQQQSWLPRQLRSIKLPFRYQSRSAQVRLWTRVQLSRRFASACPTHPKMSSSGPTSTPNRNSRSPASSGTTLTSSHGVHLICLESPGLAEHRLEVNKTARPIKQKLWRFAKDRKQAIEVEVYKLLAASFIREFQHMVWLANPVLVPKKLVD